MRGSIICKIGLCLKIGGFPYKTWSRSITSSQYEWTLARDRLVRAVAALGFPAELGELCARQLGSPKAIDRLTSYVHQEKPGSEEMLVDEMLAIYEQIKTWREKKKSEEAQWRYSMWLNSEERGE